MPSTKIKYDQEDWDFIEKYKEATGVSIQFFTTAAIKEKIANVKAEQAIKDLPFNQK